MKFDRNAGWRWNFHVLKDHLLDFVLVSLIVLLVFGSCSGPQAQANESLSLESLALLQEAGYETKAIDYLAGLRDGIAWTLYVTNAGPDVRCVFRLRDDQLLADAVLAASDEPDQNAGVWMLDYIIERCPDTLATDSIYAELP